MGFIKFLDYRVNPSCKNVIFVNSNFQVLGISSIIVVIISVIVISLIKFPVTSISKFILIFFNCFIVIFFLFFSSSKLNKLQIE